MKCKTSAQIQADVFTALYNVFAIYTVQSLESLSFLLPSFFILYFYSERMH